MWLIQKHNTYDTATTVSIFTIIADTKYVVVTKITPHNGCYCLFCKTLTFWDHY